MPRGERSTQHFQNAVHYHVSAYKKSERDRPLQKRAALLKEGKRTALKERLSHNHWGVQKSNGHCHYGKSLQEAVAAAHTFQ